MDDEIRKAISLYKTALIVVGAVLVALLAAITTLALVS